MFFQDLDCIFDVLDPDERGELDYSIYMRGVIGEMEESRKNLVRKVNIPKSNLKKIKFRYMVWFFKTGFNYICDVMVSLLTLSAIDHGFEPRLDQSKDEQISICCFFIKHTALRS